MATICGTVRRCVGTVSRHPIGADRPAMGSHGSRSGLGRSGSWDMGVPTPSQPRHSSTKWGRVLGMSHYGQRRTVLLSSTSGNQSAVRTGGSQVSQSAVEWRSAVGSRQSVSSQRRGQRRRRRRRTTTAELPAHCRTCGAGTILSGRRSRLHFAGHAALPPAKEATTAGSQSAVSGGDNDDDGGSELQRRSYLRTAGLAAPAQYLGGGAACT